MLFADKLHDIIDTLENDKVLLAPMEFAWAFTFRITDENLINIPEALSPFLDKMIYIMASDLTSVKKLLPGLHPRIETLMHYHRRPLGIKLDLTHLGYPSYLPTSCCVAFDPYVRKIIELLASPIACIYLTNGNQKLIKSFAQIPTIVANNATYIAKHKRTDQLAGIKPMVITYDEEGNLEFV